jgi:hypothetical protein
MTRIASIIAIVLCVQLSAGAAGATPILSRTWVSGAGLDTNPCTRTSPCATFGQAYSATAVGGEIDVLDGGDFGAVTINHSITIVNDGGGVARASELIVSAGGTDVAVLRGLTFRSPLGGATGLDFVSGGALVVDHCLFDGYTASTAIYFRPANAATLSVTDTVLTNDGSASSGAIVIQPQAGGGATVHLKAVNILDATGNGLRVDGANGPADVELRDVAVEFANGGSGIVAVAPASGGPTVKIRADTVTSSHNAGYGFRAVGQTASIILGRSASEGNGVGLGATGGRIFSYGDNNSFVDNVGGPGVSPSPMLRQ